MRFSLDRLARSAGDAITRMGDPRLRAEVGWVLVNKLGEFSMLFVLLKVLTNTLGKDGYGEYHLAEASLILLAALLLAPVSESFLRDYHSSSRRGEGGRRAATGCRRAAHPRNLRARRAQGGAE